MENDDDVPQLSAETFAALQEFYKEQEEKETRFQSIVNPTAGNEDDFDEDWQLSQFWYDDKTVDTLVNIACKTVGAGGKIALISCPTLYKKMKHFDDNYEVTLFEYDRRFAAFGNDFVLYDYKLPLSIPRDKSNYYDLVIADPPFLSEECLTKTAVTMKFLTKEKLILCTGAVMADLANRLLDLKKATFEPHHKNNLANEFWCFSNYDIDSLS